MEVGGLAFPPPARGAIAGAPLPMSAYGPTSSVLPGDLTPEAYAKWGYDNPKAIGGPEAAGFFSENK